MLVVTDLSKRYGTHLANDRISLQAKEGRIFGLLGPNGAGKSTLIRMITNIIQPDAGTITLDGAPIGELAMERIGYLPEERGLYKKMTVIDQLVYFGRLKGLSQRDARQRAQDWLKRLDAEGWEDKKVQELSKGMQQKVQFISTILHDPVLVILDEPFSGLDPVNVQLLIQTVRSMQSRGTTILLSTHQMHQVEQLCDDIALIDRGRVVLDGAVADVQRRYRTDRLRITSPTLDHLGHIDGTEIIDQGSNTIELRVIDASIPINDILVHAAARCEIHRFEVVQPSLHDIFVRTVTGHAS